MECEPAVFVAKKTRDVGRKRKRAAIPVENTSVDLHEGSSLAMEREALLSLLKASLAQLAITLLVVAATEKQFEICSRPGSPATSYEREDEP